MNVFAGLGRLFHRARPMPLDEPDGGIEVFPEPDGAPFDEDGYLLANPDIAAAVRAGTLVSGRVHYEAFGRAEGRRQAAVAAVLKAKAVKRARIRADLLDPAQDRGEGALGAIDCLPPDLADAAGVVATDAVSAHRYDARIQALVDAERHGWVLDNGAGSRPVYHPHVVNLEIAPYPSTDVLGVGERLPFRDGCFDLVISNAVLEHVRDPFAAAREIVRVLKPGGSVVAVVPFLQPYHGYPHHYYNMTRDGLRHLFHDLEVVEHDVPPYLHPVYTAQWFLRSWAEGLDGEARERFRATSVGDLVDLAPALLHDPVVTDLPPAKLFELACGTWLHARKP